MSTEVYCDYCKQEGRCCTNTDSSARKRGIFRFVEKLINHG